MTFATETLKPVSEKFILMQITPRRWLGVGTHVSGANYSFSVTVDRIDMVQVDGVDISPVDWSYTSGTLTVASSGGSVTFDKKVFLTGSKTRDTTYGVDGLPDEIWLPLIKEYPSWEQSIRNISEGVFSLSNTEVSVISTDNMMQEMLGPDWSFHRSVVYIYACINTPENYRVIFQGEVISASISQGFVTFQIIDSFQRLDDTATFGTQDQAYCNVGSSYTPYLPAQHQGRAIPLILGNTSPLFIENGYRMSEAFGTPAATPMYHMKDGLDCIPVTNNLDTATSVTFLCGRIVGSAIRDMSFGTISAAYVHYLSKDIEAVDVKDSGSGTVTVQVYSKLVYLKCSNFIGEIGDYITNFHGGGSQGFICAIGDFTHAGTDFNVAITSVVESEQYNPSVTSGSFSVPSPTGVNMSVWLPGSEDASYSASHLAGAFVPDYIRVNYSGRYVAFSVSYGTAYTFAGQTIKHVYATVTSSSFGGQLPGKYQFKCRFRGTTTFGHGAALKYICDSAGLETNDTSFTDADTALSTNVVMSSPPFKSSDFPKYLDLAQMITKSTFGYLSVNQNREVEYDLFVNPGDYTAVSTRDSTNTIENSARAMVDYQTIYSNIVFENDQYKGIDSLRTSTPGPVALTTNVKAKYLYKVDRTYVFKHCLENIYGRKTGISDYMASPTVEYSVTTASEDLNTNIGDIIEISNHVVPANNNVKNAVVVDIRSSTSSTEIKLNELRGI